MDIEYFENEGKESLLIKVSGDCDMYSAQNFLINITKKINSGYINIYMDFNNVIYLDSSGIGAIIRIIRLSKEKNVNLKFRGITGMPRKVLKMSNILTLISEEI